MTETLFTHNADLGQWLPHDDLKTHSHPVLICCVLYMKVVEQKQISGQGKRVTTVRDSCCQPSQTWSVSTFMPSNPVCFNLLQFWNQSLGWLKTKSAKGQVASSSQLVCSSPYFCTKHIIRGWTKANKQQFICSQPANIDNVA